jgi:DHA2 family multidrug resistance protein
MVVGQGDDDLVEYGFRRFITITAVLCALLKCRYHYCQCGTNKHERSLGATLTDVAWVITAYAIANDCNL